MSGIDTAPIPNTPISAGSALRSNAKPRIQSPGGDVVSLPMSPPGLPLWSDMDTTKEDFAAYKRWEKYIRDASPRLPGGYRKSTLLAYCLVMATYGYNGLGCYAADETIRRNLQLSNRKTVSGYRHLAKNLGWFVPNGRRGRSEKLDISIPQASTDILSENIQTPAVAEPYINSNDAKVPAVAEHNENQALTTCPACKPLIAQVLSGSLTMAQLGDIHDGIPPEETEPIEALSAPFSSGRLMH
jgi:hypothetical protein